MVRTGFRGGHSPLADGEPTRIDKHLTLSWDATQETVVVRLQPGASTHLRREVVELLVASLRIASVAPHISNHMRCRAACGVFTLHRFGNCKARELGLAFGEHRKLAFINVAPRHKGHRKRL